VNAQERIGTGDKEGDGRTQDAELREAGPDWLHARLDRLEARLEKFATRESLADTREILTAEMRNLEKRLDDMRDILRKDRTKRSHRTR
jgi:molecular chaperone GrpE (heat shock protein)